jgi:hypothetical protein
MAGHESQKVRPVCPEMKEFFRVSGFSGNATNNLTAAAYYDMEAKSFEEWARACTENWKETYTKRNESIGKHDLAYVDVVRDLGNRRPLPNEMNEEKWTPYFLFYAKLYTGIYYHLLELDKDKETSMCSKDSNWWRDVSQELCEFQRYCSEPQDSDKGGKPLHGEFAAAMTVAVVKFAEFACTFSWVGLPSYDAERRSHPNTETAASIPIEIISCAQLNRAHIDHWITEALASRGWVEKGLSKQARRFLVGILISDYNSKSNRNVSLYVSGLPHDLSNVHWASFKPNVMSAKKENIKMDDAAKLVHWCAEHNVDASWNAHVRARDFVVKSVRVHVGIYVGDALLLSATRGKERVVLARTKYKVGSAEGNRNEMCVVHSEPVADAAGSTRPLHVDRKTRGLVDEALERGRLGLVFTLDAPPTGPLGKFCLGECKFGLYQNGTEINSVEDILASSGCCVR